MGCRVVRVPTAEGSCRCKIFYPAVAVEKGLDAAYCTDGRATSDGMAGLVGFRQSSSATEPGSDEKSKIKGRKNVWKTFHGGKLLRKTVSVSREVYLPSTAKEQIDQRSFHRCFISE